jgi:hypothetical protein
MKRLTPEQVIAGHAKTPGAPSAKSLRLDHLRAIEDRDALERALRYAIDQGVNEEKAEEFEALLSEVW